jgi:uncharacterized membrane protein YkvA (DUF1232 family)
VTCVAAYVLSPVDLIPDLIPVPGHLDDLVVVPLGVPLAIRSVPPEPSAAALLWASWPRGTV